MIDNKVKYNFKTIITNDQMKIKFYDSNQLSLISDKKKVEIIISKKESI